MCVIHTCCIHHAALAEEFVRAVSVLWFPTKSENTQIVTGNWLVDVLLLFGLHAFEAGNVQKFVSHLFIYLFIGFARQILK